MRFFHSLLHTSFTSFQFFVAFSVSPLTHEERVRLMVRWLTGGTLAYFSATPLCRFWGWMGVGEEVDEEENGAGGEWMVGCFAEIVVTR
ncbi:hypothetical protein GGR54DRAFT_602589 [Hypoxylon sp. NC1633]|nr:hypothetical protein GGR54DRAFT_602589 [Hypoxylon sp. NC1633]